MAMIAIASLMLIKSLTLFTILLFILSIYAFPLICFHLHNSFFPFKEGQDFIGKQEYLPWWGMHQIQGLYNAIPQFENSLRIIPGAYSAWLRLWGSKIGKNVYWTAQIEIVDRNLMEVSDNVIFGHKVGCFSHVISIRNDVLEIYVKKIRIGANAFIGAGTNIGPGAVIGDGIMLPKLSIVSINQCIENISSCENAI
jgi:acetyltransferase-like isoleucine patch superfamily enzyme